ncbi:MAG: TfoX/Sxy family protein [Planctomycetota bacterium]
MHPQPKSEPELCARIDTLADTLGLTRRAMFGAAAWFRGGHCVAGVWGERLMLRLGPDGTASALRRRHVAPMQIKASPMRGWVFVDPPALTTQRRLRGWLDQAKAFNATLPDKPKRTPQNRRHVARSR